MQKLTIAAAILLLPILLKAQWLNWRTPDIPRTADGKPNLTAPTPRTSTGKPDLSGIWQPELNPYRFSVILDLKDEVIFRPAAEAMFIVLVGEGLESYAAGRTEAEFKEKQAADEKKAAASQPAEKK